MQTTWTVAQTGRSELHEPLRGSWSWPWQSTASSFQGRPPRATPRLVGGSTARLEPRGVSLDLNHRGFGKGPLDGPLDGPWTPPRPVEGLVQVALGPNPSGFAFGALFHTPKVRGITLIHSTKRINLKNNYFMMRKKVGIFFPIAFDLWKWTRKMNFILIYWTS